MTDGAGMAEVLRQRRVGKLNRYILFGALFLCLGSCVSPFSDFSRSRRALKRNDCVKSAGYFFRIPSLNDRQSAFALKAGLFCEKRDPASAIVFYEKWIMEQKNSSKARVIKREVEKKLAHIAFYGLKNYEKAIHYYYRLLETATLAEDRFQNHYGMAKAFFKLKKYSQGLLEAEKILKDGDLSPGNRQAVLRLKGSLLMVLERYDEAVAFFRRMIQVFPKKNSIFREYLAFIFETQGKYELAVEQLKKIPHPSAKEKIQSLSRYMKNRPKGAVQSKKSLYKGFL